MQPIIKVLFVAKYFTIHVSQAGNVITNVKSWLFIVSSKYFTRVSTELNY